MQFVDIALDENGQPRPDHAVGACFHSEDGVWRVSASDPARPAQSEWQVWQHVERSAPMGDRRRRLAWLRLPSPEAAQVVAVALAALPANASWDVARVAVRDALRSIGAALFFRSMHAANTAVARAAAALRRRAAPRHEQAWDGGQ